MLHFHPHADIFVDGKKVTVPALIGINPGAGYLTELHTHDRRGVIHIEAQKKNDFTARPVLCGVGGLPGRALIGGYSGMTWYVNGKKQTGNPQTLVLKPHQEIAFVVGNRRRRSPRATSSRRAATTRSAGYSGAAGVAKLVDTRPT